MKKSVVINGLIVGALGLVSAYGTATFAEESNSIETIPEQTVKVAEDNEPTALVVNAEKRAKRRTNAAINDCIYVRK